MKVHFTPAVEDYLDELETTLYDKEYFGFPDGARDYVHKLILDIRGTLPNRLHRPAPAYFDPHGVGLMYAAFRRNRRTTWYALFTRHKAADGTTVYLVHRIENNHTAAQYF